MILLLTDKDRDYMADQLAHGFCALLGPEQVVDFPRKPSLHWSLEPVMDCDFNLATPAWNQLEVEAGLRERAFDLIVIATLRGVTQQRLYWWRELLRLNQDRLVFVDGEDHAHNLVPALTEVVGFAPAVSFKRELPPGETWARPLPFGYPAERLVPVGTDRSGIAYTAHLWDWCGPDSMRARLKHILCEDQNVHRRLSVAEDHQWHQRALIAVSPAGRGYSTNRHLQCIADGCCPVLERPWMQWPDALIEHQECFYFRTEFECYDIVRELLDTPPRAMEVAQAAQAALLAGQTTWHRAQTVWRSIYGPGTVLTAL